MYFISGLPSPGAGGKRSLYLSRRMLFFDAAQEGTGLMVCLLQSPVSDLGSGSPRAAGRWWFLVHYFVFDGFHHWGRTFFDESAAALFCFTGPWMALLLLLVPTLCFLLPLGESFILCY